METGGIVKKIIALALVLLSVMAACTQQEQNTTQNLSASQTQGTNTTMNATPLQNTTTPSQTPANLTINASREYFFYTTSCGHCVNVLNYIYANNLSHKLVMTDVDPDSGKARYRDFATYFNIPANQWGVPVLYANNTYILGDIPIIAYLNKTFNQTN